MTWDELNKCLRSELSAVETYQQALDKERQEFGQEVEFQELSSILTDHQQAASQLEAQVQRMGGRLHTTPVPGARGPSWSWEQPNCWAIRPRSRP